MTTYALLHGSNGETWKHAGFFRAGSHRIALHESVDRHPESRYHSVVPANEWQIDTLEGIKKGRRPGPDFAAARRELGPHVSWAEVFAYAQQGAGR